MILKNELKPGNVRILIFDVDYTLTKYVNVNNLFIEAMQKYGNECTTEDIKLFFKTLDDFTAIAEYTPFAKKELLLEVYKKNFPNVANIDMVARDALENEKNFVDTMEGSEFVLKQLVKKGYTVVCLTKWFNDVAKEKLHVCGLTEHIERIFGLEDGYAKPNFMAFNNVLKHYGANEYEAVVIGDSVTDVMSSFYNIPSILLDPNGKSDSRTRGISTSVITELSDLLHVVERKQLT